MVSRGQKATHDHLKQRQIALSALLLNPSIMRPFSLSPIQIIKTIPSNLYGLSLSLSIFHLISDLKRKNTNTKSSLFSMRICQVSTYPKKVLKISPTFTPQAVFEIEILTLLMS
jgi:hypothetical protein